MSAGTQKTVYNQVVDTTHEYLGPSAERFVSRMVKTHLGKNPEQLTKKDIVKLHEWSTVAFALLTEDEKMIDDYAQSLLAIAENSES